MEPTTTVTGQKYKINAISLTSKAQTNAWITMVVLNSLARSLDQKPWKKRSKETKKINKTCKTISALIEKIVSNNKNAVTKVRTKPTPFAARASAIVRIAATVKILVV